MAAEVTVLIPTHSHGETLRYAVSSVQAQTLQDFEILIVGDGVPEATRGLVSDLAREDARIQFFDFPKGERHGERHRHTVLADARGRYVCYLSDDDLWLPSHLEHLTGLLRRSDLASSAALIVHPSGELMLVAFDLNHSMDHELLATHRSGFSLSCGGHTLEAYRRLPHGWRTTPKGTHTDTYMWQQFLEQPWCRKASAARPTVLRFEAQRWDPQPREVRLGALDGWLRRITAPGAETDIAWRAFESTWGPSPHPSAHVRHGRLNLAPDFPRYRLGEKIAFAGGVAGSSYLSWGWSMREPWGVWNDGEEARVTLSLDGLPDGNLILEVSFVVLRSPSRPSVNIELTVNGRFIARWNLLEDGVHIRSAEIPAAEQLDLRFGIPQALPARQIAETVDHRRVGLGLLSLHIRQAP